LKIFEPGPFDSDNALGQADPRLKPHALYQSLGRNDKERQAAYRALFRTELDKDAIDDIRLALNQNQPIGNERFHKKIEKVTGIRREARPRGRPRLKTDSSTAVPEGQRELGL
jgi:putative transposase